MMKCTALAAFTAALLSTAAAQAADYLSFNAGGYNSLRKDQRSFVYGAEYRFSEVGYNISPIIGAFGTGDGGVYGYGGFNWNVALIPNQLLLIPNFAIGAYGNGSGKDLGGTLEFRSGIELAYQLPNAHRIGVALNHLSNAGIYSHNPGEENIIATYSIPVSSLFGKK